MTNRFARGAVRPKSGRLSGLAVAALLSVGAAGSPALAVDLPQAQQIAPAAPEPAKPAMLTFAIGYLGQAVELPPALSNLDEPPENEGLAGAELGLADNNSTGRFLKQHFNLIEIRLEAGEDPVPALQNLLHQGARLIVADLPAASLDALRPHLDPEQMLLINSRARDNRFREAECHKALLHSIPSRAMLADALAQYLVKKRWTEWFLIPGPRPEDRLYADNLRRSAKKFGAEIVAEKQWTGEHDARRTAQAEIPVFTQGVDYDVLLVADEIGDFGEYIQYRTWTPRPVAGTQGLVAAAWGPALEAWGAAQLQERFQALAGRAMRPRDYAAWAAVRSFGEAATRTKSADFLALAAYIRSDSFELGAFKGRKLSYRAWNGQLRQPIPLLTARSLVSTSPQEGFLHQVTELDSLGRDEPENLCQY